MNKPKLVALKIKADIFQQDDIAAFGCYLDKSIKKRRCLIGLNVNAFLAAVHSKDLSPRELPYTIAETIMHEIMHALEDWAKVEFSHRRINKLINEYRKQAKMLLKKGKVA
jgi:predicted ATP-grasp superfamily ATP-dependent carboligase